MLEQNLLDNALTENHYDNLMESLEDVERRNIEKTEKVIGLKRNTEQRLRKRKRWKKKNNWVKTGSTETSEDK